MLASQMSSVSQVTKSNLVLQATITPSTAGLRARCLPTRCRHPQQVRDFRIGLWSSYLDPAFQKELQRRHRVIKHKYVDAVNRKLSWDRYRPVYASRWDLKGLMCSTWRSQDPRPGGRWVNVDELKEVKSDSEAPSGRGIEDVEQGALDDLLGRRDVHKVIYGDGSFGWSWSTVPVDSSGTMAKKSHESSSHEKTESGQGTKRSTEAFPETSGQEYDIDPITNRKVFRNSAKRPAVSPGEADPTSTEIPVKKFKGYSSHFARFHPPHGNVEGKPIQLDGPSLSSTIASGQKQSDGLRDDSECYKPFKYNEPDGNPSRQQDTVNRGLRDFDHQYKPFKYNEPDGKFPEKVDSVSAGLSDFDYEYKPFKYNEPDGKLPEVSDTVEESLREYDERAKTNSPEKSLTNKSAQKESQSALSWLSLEGFSTDTAPDRGQGESVLPREQNESMKHKIPSIQSPYSRLTKFNTAAADREDDLDLLRASDIRAASGIVRKSRKESGAEKDVRRKDLEADFDQSYMLETSSAVDVAAMEKAKEAHQQTEDLEIKRSELLNLNAHARGRVNARIAEIDAELAATNANLGTSANVTGNFARDFPEEFSASWTNEGSSTSDCLVPKKDTDAWGYDTSPQGLELSYHQEMENRVQSAENDYVAHVTSTDRATEGKQSAKFETALQRSIRASEAKAEAEYDPYTKEPQGLETSYVEEVGKQGDCPPTLFVSSYGCHGHTSEGGVASSNQDSQKLYSKRNIRKEKRENQNQNQDNALVREIRDIYESSYGTIECKHRQPTEIDTQPAAQENFGVPESSRIPQGNVLELPAQKTPEYLIEESIRIAARNAQSLEPEELQSPLPTLYKILAYDPIMQTIETAETTSIVTDTSSALTPAEVLIRLSNPAKFFPHFQPLQSQGYEIASGSGDVLIFRKVRDGSPRPKRQASPEPVSVSKRQTRKVVNPIDGMQSIPQPATGNFASPTGFVNHDLPSEHPFISGIDVRREEPVFSGRRTEWTDGDSGKDHARKSKRTARGLLVGAAWVAACSYAIGVVAEFFRTGGSDGRGPVGF